jgi:hypothetical protein
MKVWLKVLGITFVILIASVVSMIALVTQYDYNQLKPLAVRMIKDATGRDITINGNLHLVPSLMPTLSVSDITFANAPWGEKGAMLWLDQMEAKLDLLALLQGRLDVDYLVLDGLNVLLQTDGHGRANWEFEQPGLDRTVEAVADVEGALQLDLTARDIRLKNVDLTYIDGATAKRVHLLLQRADVTADSFTAPIHAVMTAVYEGVDFDAVAEMGSLDLLLGSTGDAFPVNMEINAPGLRATVDGSVEQPQAGMTVDARVVATVDDSATLDQLAGVELPNLDGLKLNMQVRGSGTKYAFSTIDARLGGNDVGGDVTVDMAGQRPRLTGTLTATTLDLDQVLGLEPWTIDPTDEPWIASSKPQGEAPSLFSAESFPLEWLRTADLDINVLAARLQAFGFTLETLKAEIQLNDGSLDIKPLSFILEDGDIHGAMRLEASTNTPTLNLETTVQRLDIGRILEVLGVRDVVTLPMDGHVDVTGEGASVRALMATLNGSARFSARDGNINDENLKKLTKLSSSLASVLPWVQHKDASVISCLVADWPIDKGTATAKTVLMDTPGFTVAVTGNVDLGGERLHLTIIPKAKSTSLASFAVPVRLKGALSAPYTDVDPGEAVVGTVGNIFKAPVGLLTTILNATGADLSADQANDPCFKALSGSNSSSQPPSDETAPPPQDKKSQPLNPVENLGKALGDLFNK